MINREDQKKLIIAVKNKRIVDDSIEYLVTWKPISNKPESWEPEDYIDDNLMMEYELEK